MKQNRKLDQAIEAAYKLGQMVMADKIYRELREGSPN